MRLIQKLQINFKLQISIKKIFIIFIEICNIKYWDLFGICIFIVCDFFIFLVLIFSNNHLEKII